MASDNLAITQVNHARIQEIERSFGPSGRPLAKPGRVLVREGRLMKHSRRGAQPKVFFLFSDVLVYGTSVISGRWNKKQKIMPLEDLQLVDLEDSAHMGNHWLIRTPRKSFYVAAGSPEEKHAWMERIAECRDRSARAPVTCMRCSGAFTATQRRHHCRSCGFLVCGACSRQRATLPHHRQRQRVCSVCHTGILLKKQERVRGMGNSRAGWGLGFSHKGGDGGGQGDYGGQCDDGGGGCDGGGCDGGGGGGGCD